LKLKADKFAPNKVADTTLDLIERDGSLKIFYNYLDSRLNKLSLLQAPFRGDKQHNKLCSCVAAPGSGKSSFINRLVKLEKEDFNSTTFQVQNLLLESVPITVTFNYLTDFKPSYEIDWAHAFTLRLIHSYFFDSTVDFEAIRTLFKNISINGESIKIVIDTIFYDLKVDPVTVPLPNVSKVSTQPNKRRIFLYVDEIVRLNLGPNRNDPFLLLQTLCSFMDTYGPAFNLFVSSLDALLMTNRTPNSGRGVKIIDLPPITYKGLLQLIETINKKNKISIPPKYVALIISSAGHPRTLSWIIAYMNRNLQSTAEFNALFLQILNYMDENDFKYNAKSIKYVLKAESVKLTDKIEGEDSKTVSNYIEESFFLNTVQHDARAIIPYTSVYALYGFADLSNSNKMASVLNSDEDRKFFKGISLPLKDLLITGDDGFEFEKFHLNWEIIRRIIEPTKLPPYFPSVLRDKFKLVPQVRKNNKFTQQFYNAVQNLDITDYQGTVLTFANNNRGFDMMIVEKLQSSAPEFLLITIECKYSTPNSGTSISADELIKKYTDTNEDLKKISNLKNIGFSNLNIQTNNIFQVFIIYRHLETGFYENLANFFQLKREKRDTQSWKELIAIEKNVIIVESEELDTIYGPSLAFLGKFFGEYLPSGLYKAINLTQSGSLNNDNTDSKKVKKRKASGDSGGSQPSKKTKCNCQKKACAENTQCSCRKNDVFCGQQCGCKNCKNEEQNEQ